MKSIIRLFAATAACSLVIGSGVVACGQGSPNAQPPVNVQHTGRQHLGNHVAGKLATELGLSAAQKSQVKAILKSAKQQRETIKSSKQAPAQKKAAMRDLGKATRAKIGAVLTPAQRARWAHIQSQRRARAGAK
jgi:Spy/CpxP family protein refolding chaperone